MTRPVYAFLASALALVLVATQPAVAGDGAVDDVSLFADRTVLEASDRVRLRGAIEPGRVGEIVEVEVRDCGQPSFRGVAGTTTEQGGQWSLEYGPGISTTIRAVWKEDESLPIRLQQRASVSVYSTPSGKLSVSVLAKTPFWRKRVLLQRRVGGSWKPVREIVLTEQIATTSGTVSAVITRARLRSPVPRGSLVRAILPAAQARPCYLAGVSVPRRTR
jgi:hypothetical protein